MNNLPERDEGELQNAREESCVGDSGGVKNQSTPRRKYEYEKNFQPPGVDDFIRITNRINEHAKNIGKRSVSADRIGRHIVFQIESCNRVLAIIREIAKIERRRGQSFLLPLDVILQIPKKLKQKWGQHRLYNDFKQWGIFIYPGYTYSTELYQSLIPKIIARKGGYAKKLNNQLRTSTTLTNWYNKRSKFGSSSQTPKLSD